MTTLLTKKGQSILEVVFLVGFLFLILTGVVATILTVSRTRTASLDRTKASTVAEYIAEKMIAQKANDPSTFWNNFPSGSTKTCRSNDVVLCFGLENTYRDTALGGYTWTVSLSRSSVNCSSSLCGQAVITINWSAKTPQSFSLTRYFARGY